MAQLPAAHETGLHRRHRLPWQMQRPRGGSRVRIFPASLASAGSALPQKQFPPGGNPAAIRPVCAAHFAVAPALLSSWLLPYLAAVWKQDVSPRAPGIAGNPDAFELHRLWRDPDRPWLRRYLPAGSRSFSFHSRLWLAPLLRAFPQLLLGDNRAPFFQRWRAIVPEKLSIPVHRT